MRLIFNSLEDLCVEDNALFEISATALKEESKDVEITKCVRCGETYPKLDSLQLNNHTYICSNCVKFIQEWLNKI